MNASLIVRCSTFTSAAGARPSLFNVVAAGPVDVWLGQVTVGGEYISASERERITGLTVPAMSRGNAGRFRIGVASRGSSGIEDAETSEAAAL